MTRNYNEDNMTGRPKKLGRKKLGRKKLGNEILEAKEAFKSSYVYEGI